MFKCLMEPGLGPQGKCEGLCVGSASIIVSGSSFHSLTDLIYSYIILYILVLQPAFTISVGGNFLFGVPSV